MGIQVAHRNILESGTVTSTFTPVTGYDLYRLYDRYLRLMWKTSSTSTHEIIVDQGALTQYPVDTLVIPAGHNLAGRTIRWQYSDDNVSYSNMVVSWVQADNLLIFKQSTVLRTKRYMRLQVPYEAGLPAIQMGELFMSELISFSPGCQPLQSGSSHGKERNTARNVPRSKVVQYVKRGDSCRWCDYQLPAASAADKILLEAWDEGFDGCKPFFFIDHDGNQFFAELLGAGDGRHMIFTPNQTTWSVALKILEVLG